MMTAVATWLLLIAGGLVTSTDSGLAVPDWPLSYGTLLPPMVGGIRYEHTHRLIAALVALMITVLAAWLWRREGRRWVRRLGYAALGAVLIQAILGGLTVLLVLPAPVSIAHACLGPLVFCVTVVLALVMSPGWAARRARRDGGALGVLAVWTTAAFVAQLVLGAVLRHTGRALMFHLAGAAAMLVMTAWLLRLAFVLRRQEPAAFYGALALAIGVASQMALGALAWWQRDRVLVTTAHQGLGVILLAGSVALTAWLMTPESRDRMRRCRRRVTDYLALTKPRLTFLALVAVLVGFLMGSLRPLDWGRLLVTLFGAALVGGGGNALNQWWERDADALMRRTRGRPLPARRLMPNEALVFGLASASLGLLLLAIAVNAVAAILGVITLVSYVALYTPMKRITSLCTLIGAVPGALPPMIGWAAARGTLALEAWVLFAILFLWQLPHFLAIAWVHREDYARAGFRMLPVVDPEGFSTARQMVLYGLALLPVSLLPTLLGVAGELYFVGAAVVGVWFVGMTIAAARHRTAALATRLFLASIGYLPVVLGLLVLDARAAPSYLPSYGQVPAFQLTDQQGRSVSRETLAGRVWVADFIFTRCAGQCPMMTARMQELAQTVGASSPVTLVSISVDPDWDTPAALSRYAQQVIPEGQPWVFLTGASDAIARLCREGFTLSLAEEEGTLDEPITHSTRLVLVDQTGRIRGYYEATDQAALKQLPRDIRTLLKERS